MGWDCVKLHDTTRVGVLRHVLADLGPDRKALASHITGDAAYLAVHSPTTDDVAGVVVAYEHRPDGWSCFKWMIEDEGPCYYDAPLSLLDTLTAEPQYYAAEWRTKCRQWATKKGRAG